MPPRAGHTRVRSVNTVVGSTLRRLVTAWCAAVVAAAVTSFAVVSSDDRSRTAVGLLFLEWFMLGGVAAAAQLRRRERPGSAVCPSAPSTGQLSRGFPRDFFFDRLVRAHRQVRILDTYSSLLADDDQRPRFLTGLRVAASQGEVQVILLDSESREVQQRAAATLDMPDGPRVYRQRIEANLRALYQLQTELRQAGLGNRFQVRLVDQVPALASYQCDDRMLATVRPLTRPAEQASQRWIRAESSEGRFIMAMFARLWEDATRLEDRLFCHIRCSSEESHPAPFVRLADGEAAYLSLDPYTAPHVVGHEVAVAGLPDGQGRRGEAHWIATALDVAEDSKEWEKAAVALYEKYRDLENAGQVVRLEATAP